MEVDASSVGAGAVLFQKDAQGRKHPCFSKTFTPAERNYSIGDRELLAMKLAFLEWRHVLEEARFPFQFTLTTRNWSLYRLHREKNICANPLSRSVVSSAEDEPQLIVPSESLRTVAPVWLESVPPSKTFVPSNLRPMVLSWAQSSRRLSWTFRIIISLFIGVVTVVVNFTTDWEIGSVNAVTTYKSFSNSTVNADIGVRVGLSGVNITLKGIPIHQINETIDYNEQFLWSFGSHFNDYYNDGLKRGLPNPILYVAEKFTQYDPCGMFNQYRISGHYASACMW
ncbi:unnamed protein product [Ranitomeya imitator]|uniref:Reverse transcriptase/retrotransposon-derived protein RNase H-like domain-containing protein n=1 Tax=Ranitomeya imitator TaxID=111125 RepID=A0ABN9LNL3_9NEOB|nr:unnamed protein product [Ranitomeya imitator]